MPHRRVDYPPAARPSVPARSVTAATMALWVLKTLDHSYWEYRNRPGWSPFPLPRLRGVISVRMDRPIFILGAARSGTTFLGGCFGALPGVSYHHEPVLTKGAAKHVYQGDWTEEQAQRLYRWTYRLLMRIHGEGHLRFAEKTPSNSHIMPFLAGAFPDAQFVHIHRDGRDSALSLSKKPWLGDRAKRLIYEPGGYPEGPYARHWVEVERAEEFEQTSHFHRCIWAWRRNVLSVNRWRALLPDCRFTELRYETLAQDSARQARRLSAFLNLDGRDARALESALATFTPGSIGRWRTELSEEQIATAHREAGDMLRHYGYLD